MEKVGQLGLWPVSESQVPDSMEGLDAPKSQETARDGISLFMDATSI